MTKDTIAQGLCYDNWDSMIKSISEVGMEEQKLREMINTYSIMIVIQSRKQFAEDTIDDCNLNYAEYAST
jgi:hypothetical protein